MIIAAIIPKTAAIICFFKKIELLEPTLFNSTALLIAKVPITINNITVIGIYKFKFLNNFFSKCIVYFLLLIIPPEWKVSNHCHHLFFSIYFHFNFLIIYINIF